MPNVKGKAAKTKQGFDRNVAAEIASGRPAKQAVAIAHSYAGTSSKKQGGSKTKGKK